MLRSENGKFITFFQLLYDRISLRGILLNKPCLKKESI
ncbi:hypothetical protein PANA5342_0580 [Pantoea ananatis LMG 5342]|nr:hypothetical protein PANA5342_0580 [Pantoea ananatis LMG 5342]